MDPSSESPAVERKPQPSAGIGAILAIGCIGAFIAGFFLSDVLRSQTKQAIPTPPITSSPSPTNGTTPSPTGVPITAIDSLSFDTGLHYFDDTVLLMTTDLPRKILIGSMVRVEEDPNEYVHNTRVSYFNGETWTRKTSSTQSMTSTITTNALVNKWDIKIDDTRVLREQVNGNITIANNSMTFESNDLQNEMSVRSLPGYTKFMSEGNGILTIDGVRHPAKVLYTRIYSMNTADIQFYSEPIGVTTDWVAFWDTAGNFYHVDATNVSKPTPIYKTHTLGIVKSASGAISKSFAVQTKRDANIPPDAYTIALERNPATTLLLSRKNSINKSPNGSYDWFLGEVEGTVSISGQSRVEGFGVVEYIHD